MTAHKISNSELHNTSQLHYCFLNFQCLLGKERADNNLYWHTHWSSSHMLCPRVCFIRKQPAASYIWAIYGRVQSTWIQQQLNW